MNLDPEAARALAQRWPDATAPWPSAGPDLLVLAWAFKDQCYAAWSSDPALAVRAADGLAALPLAGLAPAQTHEVQGLAHWTAGIACLTRGAMADAVQRFDQAGSALREAGCADAAAQCQVPKIMALSMLGRHADATACAEAARPDLLALGNRRAAARVIQNLGVLQMRCDAYAEAARHYREASVLFARLGDPVNSVLADIGMADSLTAQGDFDEAGRIYARARMRAGNQGLALQLALVDESVALLDLARGQYRPALAGLDSARRRYEALALPQYQAIAEKQMGDAYLELRLLPEALAQFDAAVARFSALALPVEQAWALAQRGRAQALLALPAAAQSLAAAADLFAAQANPAGTAAVALVRAELALADHQADAALRWAGQAVLGFAEAGQADGLGRAEVLQAQAWLAAGRLDKAGAAFDAALARADAGQQGAVRVRCLSGQGQVALARGDAQRASACFEAAIEAFEDQRSALPGDEMRSAFLRDHLLPYQQQWRLAVAGGSARDALVQLERFRARALDDRLAAGPAQPVDDATQALRERLNWLYRRVQRLHDEGENAAHFSQEMLQIEAQLLERARRQRLAAAAVSQPQPHKHPHPRPYPYPYPYPYPPSAPGSAFSIEALQAALQAGDVLLEYGQVDDELLALTVTRDAVTLHRRVADWPAVASAVRSLRFQIETLRHGVGPVRSHLPVLAARMQARLAQVHRLIWAPLWAQPGCALATARRVLVVPHGVLGAVPFAALGDGTGADVGADVGADMGAVAGAGAVAVAGAGAGGGAAITTLGQRHQLAMAPSARIALRGLHRPPVAALRALALGASLPGPAAPGPLPQVALEAQCVAGLFGQGLALVGPQASLQALRRQAPAADVLHLACHASFRSDNPRFSALALHDGALTVELAESLGLRACTVVLSACETALADDSMGDERVGLVRAFLVAGASRVLASQWPVDDAVTFDFMAHFYGALVGGAGPAAALQTAQRVTAQTHPHPYFWAAFTLYGGW